MIRHVGTVVGMVWLLLVTTACPGAEDSRKWAVRSITFEGNEAYEDKKLSSLMVTRPSRLLSPGSLHPTVLEDDLKSLVRFYKRQGYLQAEIEGYTVDRDSTARKAAIQIRIAEGPLTRMEKVTVFGNTVFPDVQIIERIGLRTGDSFKAKTLEDATKGIMTMYADQGYLESEVRPDIQVNSETNRAIVDFLIEEGDRFTAASVRIETLMKTKERVVRREMLVKPGDIIRYSELLRSQRHLYMTGLFQSVFIRPIPPSSGDSAQKDILIEIKENESIELATGIGYGTEERLRGSIEISNDNIAGTARKAGLVCEASLIRRRVETSFTEPRTLGSRVRTDLSVIYGYFDEPGYELERKAAKISFGRALGERSRASLGFKYTDDNLVHVEVLEVPEDLRARLRSLALTLVYDTRNDLSNTTGGTYVEWNNELTGAILGGTDSYARSSLRLRRFHRLTSTTVLASALEVGWMDRLRGSEEIPLGERFYTGGPNTVRGFRYQHVGPLDRSGKPIGGLFQSVVNLVEIRQDVYKLLGAVIFVDVGNVWSRIRAFHLRDYRPSAGFGLRINTPIGILRGDLGVNLDRRDGEPQTRFHFNVGQAF
jgi:outer membrane protein insertion porin family